MTQINPNELAQEFQRLRNQDKSERLVEKIMEAMPLRNLIVTEGGKPTIHDFTETSITGSSDVSKGAFYNRPARLPEVDQSNLIKINEGFFVNDQPFTSASFRDPAVIGQLQKAFPGAMVFPSEKYQYWR